MDPYMSILFMLTISFPEAMLASYLAIQLMGRKPKLAEVALIGIIQAVIGFIVRTLPIPVGLHTIILVITLSALICVISRMTFGGALIGAIVAAIINGLEELLAILLITNVTGQTLQNLVDDPYRRFLFFIPTAFAMLITIIIFKKCNITFAKLTRWPAFNEKYSTDSETVSFSQYKEFLIAVIFVFLPILLLFINFAFVSVQVNVYGKYADLFKLLFNGLIVILAFVSVWALRKISKSIEREYEIKKAAETIEQLKELIFSIRKQRHDFNHHLQAVFGLMETGDFGEARKYIENTYHYVAGAGELIKTDNPSISALLYAKIGMAETRNIRFDISIECSLEEFPLSSNEASSLLGNLIDNAFDAVDQNSAGDRAVRLNIDAARGEYLVELANRGELDPRTAEKIFEANFTTKEGHTGLGLTIVKGIVDKYKGSIRASSEGGETVFRVTLPFRR
ncbi:MAG: GHKL domain-containing protein [Peptococcaceae bacterium]|nr:GHKL domain-containing protein [Peptococcaceae bacterium]